MSPTTDLMAINSLLGNPKTQIILLLLMVWGLAWKGVALWKAANNSQRNWFIALLILNTFGIAEIIYIFYFSKSKTAKNPEIIEKP